MFRLRRRLSVVALVVLMFLPMVAQAQDQTGKITGTVKDSQGAVLPGASVVVINDATKADFRTRADGAGAWTIERAPVGTYTVTVTTAGMVPGVFKDVKVGAEASVTVDATLQVGLSDTVTVVASRTEEQLIKAPAAVSIVGERAVQDLPAQNFADLMRTIPGVNVIQVSARDFNVTPRSATNIVAQNQLVMIDGRTILQDYYGYVAWDFMTNNLDEVKDIQVLRGAASVVWGASALNGVINIVTKSPRELGSYLTMGGGMFDRTGGAVDGVLNNSGNAGSVYYLNFGHGQAINNEWAMKISGGYYFTDPLARPFGTIDNSFHTAYPIFQNYGTKAPKLDGRVDYDAPDGRQHVAISGGWGQTGGTFHTGLGPFHLDQGASSRYVKADYRAGGFAVKSFLNFWRGEARSLLARGALGAPLELTFKDNTWDITADRSQLVATRHLITVGGNFRHNWADITMMDADAKKRDDGGGYIQDEFVLSNRVTINAGIRADKYDNLDHWTASPRAALMFTPMEGSTFRASYSRAYRPPALFQNHLQTAVANRINLGLINPALNGTFYIFPVAGLGSTSLKEQTLNSYEVGWQAVLAKGRAHAGVTFYYNNSKNDMILSQNGSYTSQNVPPFWPLPPVVLDLLVAGNAFGPGLGLPSVIQYQNLGEFHNKGIEFSFDARPHRMVSFFTNYSWQARPCQVGTGDACVEVLAPPPSTVPAPKINLPPTHRFNAGMTFDYGPVMTNLSVNYTSAAYFRDVLDVTYAAWTQPFTTLNLGADVKLYRNSAVAGIKIRNVTNEAVQNHPFGDLLRRQILFELRLRK